MDDPDGLLDAVVWAQVGEGAACRARSQVALLQEHYVPDAPVLRDGRRCWRPLRHRL